MAIGGCWGRTGALWFDAWAFLGALRGDGRIWPREQCDDPSHDTTPNSCLQNTALQCTAMSCEALVDFSSFHAKLVESGKKLTAVGKSESCRAKPQASNEPPD